MYVLPVDIILPGRDAFHLNLTIFRILLLYKIMIHVTGQKKLNLEDRTVPPPGSRYMTKYTGGGALVLLNGES